MNTKFYIVGVLFLVAILFATVKIFDTDNSDSSSVPVDTSGIRIGQ